MKRILADVETLSTVFLGTSPDTAAPINSAKVPTLLITIAASIAAIGYIKFSGTPIMPQPLKNHPPQISGTNDPKPKTGDDILPPRAKQA